MDCRQLDAALPWYGTNRDRLQQMIDLLGRCGSGYDGSRRPVAVFDWDNTVVKNDVGDAMVFWLLRHDKVLQPPAKDWSRTSRYLTSAATEALSASCGHLAGAGRPLPTSTDVTCADEIFSIYTTGRTTDGAAAFAGWNRRRMEPGYAWAAQLLAGYSRDEVHAFAAESARQNLSAPIGTTQTVGSHTTVTGWVRYYDQQRDLIATLRADGFDVWVATASPQWVVETWAQQLDIAPSRILGIRSVVTAGRSTYRLQGCGDVPSGEDSVITYIDGKRCWINSVIYGITGEAAFRQADLRPAFAAGDSDTDITFLRDATTLKLVLNRNKTEIMCHAYYNAGGGWVINPMFIQPKAQRSGPYPCDSAGSTSADGTPIAAVSDSGVVIPPQYDTVFG